MPCRWSEGQCDVRKRKSHSSMMVVRRCGSGRRASRERSGCQSFVADLTSIVSAATNACGVDPPVRVWPLCTRNWKEKASSVVR